MSSPTFVAAFQNAISVGLESRMLLVGLKVPLAFADEAQLFVTQAQVWATDTFLVYVFGQHLHLTIDREPDAKVLAYYVREV